YPSSYFDDDGLINSFNRGYLCDAGPLGLASGMGGFTFLCAILFVLQGCRIWSNKKRGIPIFQITTSRGLAETSVLFTTIFVVVQLVLGWAGYGVIKSACSNRETAIGLSSFSIRLAQEKIETAHESIYTFGSVLFPPSLTLNS